MSTDHVCEYCGAYLCSDRCDITEASAEHIPACLSKCIAERDVALAQQREAEANTDNIAHNLGVYVAKHAALAAKLAEAENALAMAEVHRDTWKHRTLFEQKFTEEMRAERDALRAALRSLVDAIDEQDAVRLSLEIQMPEARAALANRTTTTTDDTEHA